LVVTAGVQSLRPNQQVRLLGEVADASIWASVGAMAAAADEASAGDRAAPEDETSRRG
jgi:hypothetical protein